MFDAPLRRLRRLGPFAPLVLFLLTLFVPWIAMRAALVLWYRDRLAGAGPLSRLFAVGLHMDVITACYAAMLPLLLVLVRRRPGPRLGRPVLVAYLTLLSLLALFFEVATPSFMAEFDMRPNRQFFENLGSLREVAGMLLGAYLLPLIGAVLLLVVVGWAAQRAYATLAAGLAEWSAGRRLLCGVPALALLFLGARGTLSHRPANISTAAFSENQLANQLALNSIYTMAYAIYSLRHETDPSRLYGTLPPAEILDIVRHSAGIPADEPIDPRSPLLHRAVVRAAREAQTNVVIVLEESLGAEFVGCLGGLPLTPNIDRLAPDGLLLTQLYSTGTRTARGIEAVVAGFPPSPARSAVKLALAQSGFFTLGQLLAAQGYATEFIYGGESHFDDMRTFFLGNGFQHVYDEPAFTQARFRGTWGVSDEDLFERAHEIFEAHGSQPFFAVILSTSNHTPFEFPAGAIELYEQPQATRNNAMKYADHAIGRLFELARGGAYYERTLFVIVADHNTRTYGNELVPVNKFHIPGLILGPGVPRMRYDRVASQLDLGPTILDLIGLAAEHPMIGRSLLGWPADDPGRAIMQFESNHAYMQGDQVLIHLPHKGALQFAYRSGTLVPVALDPALERVALAHALLPGLLYDQELYRGRWPARSRGSHSHDRLRS
jgi:phosphoglycerol transferase MdoB-like AlkP superfamily enzyme